MMSLRMFSDQELICKRPMHTAIMYNIMPEHSTPSEHINDLARFIDVQTMPRLPDRTCEGCGAFEYRAGQCTYCRRQLPTSGRFK